MQTTNNATRLSLMEMLGEGEDLNCYGMLW